jgi:hypothetical protein
MNIFNSNKYRELTFGELIIETDKWEYCGLENDNGDSVPKWMLGIRYKIDYVLKERIFRRKKYFDKYESKIFNWQ